MRALKPRLSWLSLLNGLEGGRGERISDRGFFRRDSRAAMHVIGLNRACRHRRPIQGEGVGT